MRWWFGAGLAAVFLLGSCALGGPVPRNGVLDLSNWDVSSQPQVALDGFWLAHRDDGRSQATAPLALPGAWNSGSVEWAPEATVSYRLRVRLPPHSEQWAVYLPEIHSAAKLLIDGVIVREVGVVGTSSSTEVPRVQPQVVSFQAVADAIDIELQVSNYHARVPGVMKSIRLGTVSSLQSSLNWYFSVEAFTAGGLLMMAILNALMARFRNQRPGLQWFSILAVVLAFRALVTGPYVLLELFPGLSFETITILKHLTIVAAGACFVFYTRRVFPENWPSQIFLGFLLYSMLFAVLAFFLSSTSYAQAFVMLYLPALAAALVLCLGLFLSAAFRKEREALGLLPGILLLFLAAVNDGAAPFTAVVWGPVLPQAMFLFMLYNAVLATRKMKETFDLSHQQAIELRDLDKMKDDFLARVTHELRTPLHGMIGILDAFRMGDYGSMQDRQSYHLSLLESSSKRLLSMVNSILDFSQLKKGTLVSESRPIFLKEAIDFLIPSFYVLAHPGVALVNRVSAHMPPALGDDSKVEQVLHHLLSNALAHTRSGTVSLEGELQDQRVVITVRDTGSGIEPEIMKSLFTPFQQGLDADTREKNGLGLGLAISRQLIHHMGGTLTLESTLGVGTTVRLVLPVCPPAKLQYFLAQRKDREIRFDSVSSSQSDYLPTLPIEPEEVPRDASHPVVLIVDDEPVNLLVLKTFLQRLEYHVLEASNGPEALQQIDQTIVDLVILDIMMPGMSGYEVCRRMRERFSPARLPVLLLTAKNQMDDLITGFHAGASDFLTKPFIREELKARMEFHLELSASARNGTIISNKS